MSIHALMHPFTHSLSHVACSAIVRKSESLKRVFMHIYWNVERCWAAYFKPGFYFKSGASVTEKDKYNLICRSTFLSAVVVVVVLFVEQIIDIFVYFSRVIFPLVCLAASVSVAVCFILSICGLLCFVSHLWRLKSTLSLYCKWNAKQKQR